VFKKYGFTEYRNPKESCVFWGCYPSTRPKLLSHQGFAVVVWRGSDAMFALKNRSYVQFLLKNTGRIKHIAISNFIERDLRRAGLPFIPLPLTSMSYDLFTVMPRGDAIYLYAPPEGKQLTKHDHKLLQQVLHGLPFKVHRADKLSHTRQDLMEIYRDCFLGIRLLPHDGLSNTMVELGLCGRMCISNSNLPNAIGYTDAKSVIQIIDHEHKYRSDDNSQIAEDMRKYINVPKDWLNIKFWEDK
jgi:hypothetical protein